MNQLFLKLAIWGVCRAAVRLHAPTQPGELFRTEGFQAAFYHSTGITIGYFLACELLRFAGYEQAGDLWIDS